MIHREMAFRWTFCLKAKHAARDRTRLPAEDEVVGPDREHEVDCPDCLKGMAARDVLSNGRGAAKKL